MNRVLLKATENKQTVQLIYLDANHQLTQRKILPYTIKGQHVRAYCFLRNQIRFFKLENILAVLPDHQRFPKMG